MSELKNKLKKEFKNKEYAHAYVNEFLNASIATQIKVLREQRGWDQKELALLTDMKQPRISLLENINYDMWSISTLKKLAEAFDVTLNVSFESFSKRIDDIEKFSRESLQRQSRVDALSSEEQTKQEELATTNQTRLIADSILSSGAKNTIHNPITRPDKHLYLVKDAALTSNMENANG